MNILMPVRIEDYDVCIETIDRLYELYPGQITDVFVIGQDKNFFHPKATSWSETDFEFTEEILKTGDKYGQRAGWILQQLLKLKGALRIDNNDKELLIWESEAYGCKPIQFKEDDAVIFYKDSRPAHYPYYSHSKKLLNFDSTIVKKDNWCGDFED